MNAQHFGPQLTSDGARFRLWAPAAKRADLLLEKPHALTRDAGGWYVAEIPGARAGTRYKFRIDDEVDVPDPASAFQPDDVFGPSEVIDHAAFKWRATGWRGRPWHEAVILEAHVGTFTPEGTYRAMIDKLDHLVATGITTLELMPLADFAGRRNWGYDGVLWYAPDSAYGRPDDLKTLIDEAHQRGLMVMLDVVYNHFGPEGNYLGRYAPSFFSDAHTPWGSAIDYRVPEVRAFAIGNTLNWLRDYRFDGLRLDAVNTIVEAGEVSILHDLSDAAGRLAAETGRHINLVLENGDNIASLLDATEDPPRGKYRGQWNDDYHHAWHVILTGETQGYYGDYRRAPKQDLARALASGYVYQGEVSTFWGGKARGEPSGARAPTCFINFLQNHDQIGNRPLGDRLVGVAKPEAVAAALAVTLIAPTTPMLFMGEEWGATSPFPFFCDFKGDLANAVRKGRRKEFAWAYAKYGDDIPDPLADDTLRSAVLDWTALDHSPGRARLALVRDLLAVRRREIAPRLAAARFGDARITGDLLTAHWTMGDGSTLQLAVNLSDREIASPVQPTGRLIWGHASSDRIAPWSVRWYIG
ncbi:malto-oligosyltrehalose trehalohydrolase [Bradyrhizobium sp. ISRA443]|uniref:malto-oligosyltrehalose trehalohydrolase n=1 Tax=unclassified Bradyrhizobium TaxID=2631580 RepID=UPI002479E344|nr:MULTISPECIES: malto-oligosyltrehalose trehalohydrolase [unclassified Bradyrhizobium]WGS00844.1 malto-oligosyltrehalose trehalohydrolase [Bradyrhizobium sp. ISRA436]WGS07731.1 malto-oligosyltrehalose trehalohydrolase [Bradyrhizobium sp. ISRA437]WGS14619.1 malto-oligosyltrehalose trehalohydrolase [Bradyrhizobium sp. ISRA443]